MGFGAAIAVALAVRRHVGEVGAAAAAWEAVSTLATYAPAVADAWLADGLDGLLVQTLTQHAAAPPVLGPALKALTALAKDHVGFRAALATAARPAVLSLMTRYAHDAPLTAATHDATEALARHRACVLLLMLLRLSAVLPPRPVHL